MRNVYIEVIRTWAPFEPNVSNRQHNRLHILNVRMEIVQMTGILSVLSYLVLCLFVGISGVTCVGYLCKHLIEVFRGGSQHIC